MELNFVAIDSKPLNVIVCEFDVTNDNQFRQKHKIEGYPTLRLYIRGVKQPIEYFGARDLTSIMNFLTKRASPASELIESE